jgi:hypothetical protein
MFSDGISHLKPPSKADDGLNQPRRWFESSQRHFFLNLKKNSPMGSRTCYPSESVHRSWQYQGRR